jgi:hypothetical protein
MTASAPRSFAMHLAVHMVLVALLAPALVLGIHSVREGGSPFDILLPYLATPFVFGAPILGSWFVSALAFHFARSISPPLLQHFLGLALGTVGGLLMFRFVVDAELHDSTLGFPCIFAGAVVGVLAPFFWRYEKRQTG